MTKRYQWGKQKASIEKGLTILCPKDTNRVIRSLRLKRDRQYYDQKIKTGNTMTSIEKGTDNTMTKRYQWGNQKPSIEKGQTIL